MRTDLAAGQSIVVLAARTKAEAEQVLSRAGLGIARGRTIPGLGLSRLSGTPALLTATLTDSGIPLSSAAVSAVVTGPSGGQAVRASGANLRGTAFTREEFRTFAVWARGDEAPPLVIDADLDPVAIWTAARSCSACWRTTACAGSWNGTRSTPTALSPASGPLVVR